MTRWLFALWSALFVCALATVLVPAAQVSGKSHGRATQGLDCGVCHTPASWKMSDALHTAAGFNHDLTGFPLRAGHQRAACTACHDGRKVIARDCVSCHRDEHQGKLGQACDKCHNATAFRVTDQFKLHAGTRLPLTGMHVLVDCNDCHRRMSSEGYASTPSQCFACHEQDYRRKDIHPVHDGSHGDKAFPRNCAECHTTAAFAPAVVDASRFLSGQSDMLNFDVRAHDRAFVVSRGSHRGAPCASCHLELKEPRMVRCTGCHAHEPTLLAAQHKNMITPSDGSCLACHAGGAAR